jgi:hypothetical protein
MKVEIIYIPRSKWPKRVIEKFHEVHLKVGRKHPRCPLCKKAKRGS